MFLKKIRQIVINPTCRTQICDLLVITKFLKKRITSMSLRCPRENKLYCFPNMLFTSQPNSFKIKKKEWF